MRVPNVNRAGNRGHLDNHAGILPDRYIPDGYLRRTGVLSFYRNRRQHNVPVTFPDLVVHVCSRDGEDVGRTPPPAVQACPGRKLYTRKLADRRVPDLY